MLNQNEIQTNLDSTITDLDSLISELEIIKSNVLAIVMALNYHYGNYYSDYKELHAELVSVEQKLVWIMFRAIGLLNELKTQKPINNTQ